MELSTAHRTTAFRGGWSIASTFRQSREVVEIQRLDCPAQTAEDVGWGWDALPVTPVFESDAAAEKFVRERAQQGCLAAQLALKMITYSHLKPEAPCRPLSPREP